MSRVKFWGAWVVQIVLWRDTLEALRFDELSGRGAVICDTVDYVYIKNVNRIGITVITIHNEYDRIQTNRNVRTNVMLSNLTILTF